MLVDGGDVVLNAAAAQYVQVYNTLDRPIVMGVEALCSFESSHCGLWGPNPLGFPYRWPNAGM